MNLDYIEESQKDDFLKVFELLSPGWKTFVITADEDKFTYAALDLAKAENRAPKQVDGLMWVVTMECIKSPVRTEIGSAHIERFNMFNPNDNTQRWGRAAASKLIFDGIGKPEGRKNTKLLYGIPFEAKIAVKEQESKTDGKMYKNNEIRDYRKAQAHAPVKTDSDFGFQNDEGGWLE